MGFLALIALFVVLVAPTYVTGSRAVRAEYGSQAAQLLVDVQPAKSPAVDPIAAYARMAVSKMSLEEKLRSLLMLHYPGTDPATLQSFMSTTGAGGFILMGNNIPVTEAQLVSVSSALTINPELPALIGIDEEGGDVTRLPYDTFAGANALRGAPVSATLEAFTGRGALLQGLGINTNFGIVADQTDDSHSFIYSRSFGGVASETSPRVSAAVSGEQGHVFSTLKHFPGHGSAPGDSHVSIPASSLSLEQWQASDAVPFLAGIDAGAELVMFGHLSFASVDSTPSSLSKTWHDYLRTSMGFDGVIITDDMMMLQRSGVPELTNDVENAIRAVEAGNDVLLYVLGADYAASEVNPDALIAGLMDAVTTGRIPEEQVTQSVLRVVTLRRSLAPDASSWIPPCDIHCFVFEDLFPAR